MRTGLACLAAGALSACFYSEDELIGFWGADRGIEPGVYTHTPYDTEGEEWSRPTWEGPITYDGRRYVSETANFPHQDTRLKELGDGLYIAQSPREDGVVYGVVFTYPGMATYHQPDCAALSEAARADAGVTLDREGYCRVDDLDALEAAMRAYLAHLDGDVRIDGIYRRVPE
ncbi:hypothetical protein DDZ18_09520 [Marinicauda salina]|uniref:Lipoprotein n=1 Tax=Marinicauda salina TaxID=2135793 RepID=A0A2U2BSH1_9PROT|nr:hypothetical protein DDZ18_09520 [Marinicauda salina]